MTDEERIATFEADFEVFPWDDLPKDATGFDLGCGSGRWAAQVAPRVGTLHCVDPSDAIDVARRNLANEHNVVFHRRTAGEMPFAAESMDFGYSLGVLHHVEDTDGALRTAVRALKPVVPLLVYPQMEALLRDAGRTDIRFCSSVFCCAVGTRS